MSPDRIRILAPATLSNLGCGFDIFGMALREPYDVIEAERTSEPGVIIESIEGPGSDSIPLDAARNSAGLAAMAALKLGRADFGMSIRITKGIRPCSGIGSSGASAAGAAYAANQLMDGALGPQDVVLCAAQAEGTGHGFHADNVGPSVLGGFTIIRSYDPFEIIRIEPPARLRAVVVMPDVLVCTKDARSVLPSQVGLKDMIAETGAASALVAGMMSGDIPLIGRSLTDLVIGPARAHLNPHMAEAMKAATSAGAAGAFLGGSGPCVIAFHDEDADARSIAASMSDVYISNGLSAHAWTTGPGQGCRRL